MDTVHAVAEEHVQLAQSLADQGMQYLFASFIDVTGRAKSKCVPVAQLPELIAGHERYTPEDWVTWARRRPTRTSASLCPTPRP